MKNPLRKRILREIFREKGKYTALFLFLVILVGFCSAVDVAAESMAHTYRQGLDQYRVEDGHFTLDKAADEVILQAVADQQADCYELYYKDKNPDPEHTIRIYKNREEVNLPCIMEGRLPESADEIALDRLYAENNKIQVGDIVPLEGKKLTVCGTVALSDYSTMYRNNNDMMFNASLFSVALMTPEGFESLDDTGLVYCYAWRFQEASADDAQERERCDDMLDAVIASILGMPQEEAEKQAEEVGTLVTFLHMLGGAEDSDYIEKSVEDSIDHFVGSGRNEILDFVGRPDNNAIVFTIDDIVSDQVFTNFFLYILILILAFIYAVTTRNTIEQEASVIGTLRASGYTRAELLAHYLMPTMIVNTAGAIIGNILGYTALKYVVVGLYYHSYSLPRYTTVWSGKAFLSTTILPFVIILIVNSVILYRSLTLSPLRFLRHDFSRSRKKRVIRLPRCSFLTRFRLRVLIQNIPAYLVMLVGILLAGLLMSYGLLFVPMLHEFKKVIIESSTSEYQYILKNSEETDTPGAEKFAVETLSNGREDITVYGITPGSVYFTDLDYTGEKEDTVYISSAFSEKYDLGPGDYFSLQEKYGEHAWSFHVGGVRPYEAGLIVYLSLDNYNETFDHDEDYFNGYLTNEEITDINSRDIATVITAEDLTVLADQLEDSIGGMFTVISVFAVILFILIIYLLARLVIDRNAKSISMMKILGYSGGEISRLYNRATAMAAIASLLLSLPFSYITLKLVLKILMMNYNGWITAYIAPWVYAAVMGLGAASYGVVHILEMRRINRIPLAEALKDAE